MRDRTALLVLLGALACHACLTWAAREPAILMGQDDAEYVLLARAIGEGSYREPWRVDAPLHTQYPPGYPVLLAAWSTVWGESYAALLSLSTLLSGSALLLVFAAVRRRFGPAVASGSVLVLAVNPYIVQFAGSIASEAPYLFYSALCLYALLRVEDARTGTGDRSPAAWLAVGMAAALAAALTRSAGVSLVGAVGLWLLLTRRMPAALIFGLMAAAAVGGWLAFTVLAPEQFVGRSYIADLQEGPEELRAPIGRRLLTNAWGYATESTPRVLSIPTITDTLADTVITTSAILALVGTGFLLVARRWRLAALYVLAYLAVLVVFRWQVHRFLVPLLPLIVVAALTGAAAMAERLRRGLGRWALLAAAVALIVGGAADTIAEMGAQGCEMRQGIPAGGCLTPVQGAYFDALRVVRDELPADAVLLTAKSGALFYYTGRRSISVEGARDQPASEFLEFVRNQGASYILLSAVDGVERQHYSRLVREHCDVVRLIRSFGDRTFLFGVDGDGGGGEIGSAACDAMAQYRELVPLEGP